MNRRQSFLHLDQPEPVTDAAVALPALGRPIDEPADAAEPIILPEADEDEDDDRGSGRGRLFKTLAALIVLGWTVAYGLIHLEEMREGASGSLWLAWIGEWVIPVLLVVVICQQALRMGSGERARLARAAALLSEETHLLEARLGTVNRELSLAREFLASQSRDLEALGRQAAERLHTSAQGVQMLVEHNAQELARIGEVGESAVRNMEKLRDQLPVLATSARDMTSQIGNAGNVAAHQMQQLATSLEQLEQYGMAGERHVEMISGRMSETLELFERHAGELGGAASDQFTMLQRSSEEFRNLLKTQDEAALATWQKRAAQLTEFLEKRNARLLEIENVASTGMRERLQAMVAQNDEMLRGMVDRRNEASNGVTAMIEALEQRLTETIERVSQIDESALRLAQTRLAALANEANQIDATLEQQAERFTDNLQQRRAAMHMQEMQALAALDERLAGLDDRLQTRETSHLDIISALAERGEALAVRLARFDADMIRLAEQAESAREGIGQSADLLSERLAQSREILGHNRATIAELVEAGGRMQTLAHGLVTISDNELVPAMSRVEAQLSAFQAGAQSLYTLVESAESKGAALAGHIGSAREHGSETFGLIEQLESQLAQLAEKTEGMTSATRVQLQAAVDLLQSSTTASFQTLRDGQSAQISEVASQIAAQSGGAIVEALQAHAATAIAQIEASARAAGEAGRQSATQLRDQLVKINQLTGNLEQRVSAAREKAEEQLGDDFARRMALITEALHSSSVDIAKAFDNDVADTHWANYLRGDRGIFTRRAVRLLDKAEARSVLEFYEADSQFRETVNRYIHDFEAMLRGILSTRDGNALAVTLLSSDVGKLYVCLAQAIERLRA